MAAKTQRVLPGFGGRFERARSTVLKRGAGGSFVGTFRAPEPFRQIEVEPGRLPGPFRLERLVLRRMGPFAVANMALAGAIRAARRGPGPLAGYLKAALATILNPRRFETAQPPGGGGAGNDDPERRYAAWLAARPDSHIVRKFGADIAEDVRKTAETLRGATARSGGHDELMKWDAAWKRRSINPGTSADLTVATILPHLIRPIT